MGRRKDALRLFNRLRRLANDVGLYAEEYDPQARRMLGNFPQAFSHVALDQYGAESDDAPRKNSKKDTPPVPAATKRILCIDVGGTGLKAAVISPRGKILVKRHRDQNAQSPQAAPRSCKALADLVTPFRGFDHVTIGFPGVCEDGRVFTAPHLGTKDWAGFDLAAAMREELGKPVKLLNDADVQGLAVIQGKGLELVCTLGTGFGTAWFRDGELMPHMDLAHLAMRKKDDFDDYTRRQGPAKRSAIIDWNRRIKKLIGDAGQRCLPTTGFIWAAAIRSCVKFKLPRNVTIVSNDAGMEGGAFAWSAPRGRVKPA